METDSIDKFGISDISEIPHLEIAAKTTKNDIQMKIDQFFRRETCSSSNTGNANMKKSKNKSSSKNDEASPDHDIFHLVQNMFDGELYTMALQHLEINSNILPPSYILQQLIYEILMNKKDTRLLTKTYCYIMGLIQAFPPDNARKKYYAEVLFSKQENLSTYDFICKLFDCFAYGGCSAQSDVKCNKNCARVFRVIMHVLKENHSWCMSQNDEKCNNSLICEMFWPLRNTESVSENVRDLICKVNTFYGLKDFGDFERFEAHKHLMDLFDMVAETALSVSTANKVNVITHSHYSESLTVVDKIKDQICFSCTNIKKDANRLTHFLDSVTPQWLEVLLAQAFINDLLGMRKSFRKKLCLRTIVLKYMFKPKSVGDKGNKSAKHFKKHKALKKGQDNTESPKTSSSGIHSSHPSKLHEACIKNKVYTLTEYLDSLNLNDDNFTLKDSNGKTPLSYACENGYIICIQTFLIKMEQLIGADKIKFEREVFAADENGNTPLHICVKKDNFSAIDILLCHGGSAMLSVMNNDGETPLDLVQSSKTRKTLVNAGMKMNLNSTLQLIENATPVFCDNLADSDIYFSCLLHIFSSYSDYFKFEDLLENKPNRDTLSKLIENYVFVEFKYITEDDDVAQFCDDVYTLYKLKTILNRYLMHFSDHFNNDSHSEYVEALKQLAETFYFEYE